MKILFHICCSPCSLMPIQELQAEKYEATGFFYNPNIHPTSEYLKRKQAYDQFLEIYQLADLKPSLQYDLKNWLDQVYARNIADNQNKMRCSFCYHNRLELTAKTAKEHGFEAFSTSLLYSKYQEHELIKNIGRQLEQDYQIKFVYQDWRLFWQQGIKLSKELGLYRQNYCACIFSEAERFRAKTPPLIPPL